MPEPQVEGLMTTPTIILDAATDNISHKVEAVDIEWGPISATPTPEASTSKVSTPGMVHVSVITFQAMAQRLSCAELRGSHLGSCSRLGHGSDRQLRTQSLDARHSPLP